MVAEGVIGTKIFCISKSKFTCLGSDNALYFCTNNTGSFVLGQGTNQVTVKKILDNVPAEFCYCCRATETDLATQHTSVVPTDVYVPSHKIYLDGGTDFDVKNSEKNNKLQKASTTSATKKPIDKKNSATKAQKKPKDLPANLQAQN